MDRRKLLLRVAFWLGTYLLLSSGWQYMNNYIARVEYGINYQDRYLEKLENDNKYYQKLLDRHNAFSKNRAAAKINQKKYRFGKKSSPAQIYKDADYLVKVNVFAETKIPMTGQTVKEYLGHGSGSVVPCEKYGYCVLTAFHVVSESSTTFFAEFRDGSAPQLLTLIAGTTHYDAAVLHFANPKFTPKVAAKLGDSAALAPGSPVVAMGSNRLGNFWVSAGGYTYTSTSKTPPGLAQKLAGTGLLHPRLIIMNTPIFRGYSGGPLINEKNELIGISIGITPLDAEAIYLGSPINQIKEQLKILK